MGPATIERHLGDYWRNVKCYYGYVKIKIVLIF